MSGARVGAATVHPPIASEREITGEETRLTGMIRITTPDVPAPRIVVPMLGRFHVTFTLPCYIGDADENLVRLVEPRDVIQSDLWLVIHRDLQHTARVRACADHLAAGFRGMSAALSGKSGRAKVASA